MRTSVKLCAFVLYQLRLTEPAVLLIQLSVLSLPGTPSKQPVEEDVEVAEDDERWWQDGTVVERHDQLVPLELPHLVGNGLDFKECVAVGQGTRTSEYTM